MKSNRSTKSEISSPRGWTSLPTTPESQKGIPPAYSASLHAETFTSGICGDPGGSCKFVDLCR